MTPNFYKICFYGYLGLIAVFGSGAWVIAGPYNEPGISGYVNNDGLMVNLLDDPNAVINPMFCGWATDWKDYLPADNVPAQWSNAALALGLPTGDSLSVVALGDLDTAEVQANKLPGQITLIFADPNDPNDLSQEYAIRNGKGYDFAVFENGFISEYDSQYGTVGGQMFGELAYVEVSSDGTHYVRFPVVSTTPMPTVPTWSYLTLDVTNIYNLAGKHPNSLQAVTGTPFDLEELVNAPLVLSGDVDLNNIHYVRIVDVPGSGDWVDDAATAGFIDPQTWPNWQLYSQDHGIYDCWLTMGSGGFDLEAIGVIKEQQYSADINLDGRVNLKDFAIFSQAWKSHFGGSGWVSRCNFLESRNLEVDFQDLIIFMDQWLSVELWAITPD